MVGILCALIFQPQQCRCCCCTGFNLQEIQKLRGAYDWEMAIFPHAYGGHTGHIMLIQIIGCRWIVIVGSGEEDRGLKWGGRWGSGHRWRSQWMERLWEPKWSRDWDNSPMRKSICRVFVWGGKSQVIGDMLEMYKKFFSASQNIRIWGHQMMMNVGRLRADKRKYLYMYIRYGICPHKMQIWPQTQAALKADWANINGC